MMLTGYYTNPYRRSAYIPEATMTAFASGGPVGTNSFTSEQISGQEPEPLGIEIPLDVNKVEADNPEPQAFTPEPVEEEVPATKKILKKRPQPEEDSDDEPENDDSLEEAFFPLMPKGRQGIRYNSFFPIIFGARGYNSRSSDDEGVAPGGATAIANSFSTGKGGVASSHAVAYGDPSLRSSRKNDQKKAKRH